MSHYKPHLPYITKAIKKLMGKRDKLHAKAKKKHSAKYWKTFRSQVIFMRCNLRGLSSFCSRTCPLSVIH